MGAKRGRNELSPTGLCYTGDETIESALAESHTGTAELTEVTVATAAHGAAINETAGTCVARELGKTRVIVLGLKFGAQSCVFLDSFGLLLIAFDPCLFGHKYVF
jgi:hypothetical protein